MINRRQHNNVNIHHMFHTLWSKAVGTPTYVKREWMTLDIFIARANRRRGVGRRIGDR